MLWVYNKAPCKERKLKASTVNGMINILSRIHAKEVHRHYPAFRFSRQRVRAQEKASLSRMSLHDLIIVFSDLGGEYKGKFPKSRDHFLNRKANNVKLVLKKHQVDYDLKENI